MADYRKALQEGYRYETVKGYVTTEDLYDIPLRNNKGFNLGTIAKTISETIKQGDVENFVPDVADDKETTLAKDKLEIVKDVITIKLVEEAKRKNAKEIKAQKDKLLSALAEKRDEAIKNKSEAEILAELAALEA